MLPQRTLGTCCNINVVITVLHQNKKSVCLLVPYISGRGYAVRKPSVQHLQQRCAKYGPRICSGINIEATISFYFPHTCLEKYCNCRRNIITEMLTEIQLLGFTMHVFCVSVGYSCNWK
jgi:hypothetical protein